MMRLTTLPFVKKIWAKVRLRKILRSHQEVATFWKPVVDEYFRGNISRYRLNPKKEELIGKKVIWQYWGQGFTSGQLPGVVEICLASVEKHKGDYEIIRLSDNSLSDYIDLPCFVLEKRDSGIFSRTFFSDLLRLALLKAYGGVWLDATVLLTDTLTQKYSGCDYFVYQRDSDEVHKEYWENSYAYYWGWHPKFSVKMLNSIMFAKKDSLVISSLLDLVLHYWKTENHIIDYFFFQILYEVLMTGQLAEHRCHVVSDTIPHALQSYLNSEYNLESKEEIFRKAGLHKLSYKTIETTKLLTIIEELNSSR